MKTNSLRAWLLAVRPYSFGGASIPVFVASALAVSDGVFRWAPALLCLLFALAMQCAANLVNDLFDLRHGADRPEKLGDDRAFAKGYITPRAMNFGIAAFFAASALIGAGLLWYGGWELLPVGAACLLFAYVYTGGPWPLAYHGLGDAAVVLFFGIVPVGFTYYILSHTWTWEVTLAGLACGLVIDTMLMVNNFRDIEEDAECGKRTMVVVLGAAFGRWGYLFLGTAATALCLLFVLSGRWGAALLPLLYWVLFFRTWRKMVAIGSGDGLNLCLAATARNLTLFGILLTIGLLL